MTWVNVSAANLTHTHAWPDGLLTLAAGCMIGWHFSDRTHGR